jgi:hypothetical protein
VPWRSFLLLVFGWGGVGLLSGCDRAPATVRGEVIVDGKPLQRGYISYVPADEDGGVPATADVQNGTYELRTFPGNKRVQISAPVVVGTHREYDSPDAALVEITEESLPEWYNSKTELTFEVQPGRNTKNWSVESKLRQP